MGIEGAVNSARGIPSQAPEMGQLMWTVPIGFHRRIGFCWEIDYFPREHDIVADVRRLNSPSLHPSLPEIGRRHFDASPLLVRPYYSFQECSIRVPL